MTKKTKMSGRDSEFARHLLAKYGPGYRIAESSNGLKDRKMIVRIVPGDGSRDPAIEVVARGHSWAAAERNFEKALAAENATAARKRHQQLLSWGLGLGAAVAVVCIAIGVYFWLT